MTEKEAFCKSLQNTIVADIVLSGDAGLAIRKWRGIFKISQRKLAGRIGFKSSIISDYESGRRKSPGAIAIKKITEAFTSIEGDNWSSAPKGTNGSADNMNDAIIDMHELGREVTVAEIAQAVNGKIIAERGDSEKSFSGYTIVGSIRAITAFSPTDFSNLYNHLNGKAVVFTGVERGRSPLVAIKVANIKPVVVIFHGLNELDKVAERIARVENIPVIISGLKTIDEVMSALKSL